MKEKMEQMLSQRVILEHFFSIFSQEKFQYNFLIRPIYFLEKVNLSVSQLFYIKPQGLLVLNANKTVYFFACITQFFVLHFKDQLKDSFKYLKMHCKKFIYFIFYQVNKSLNLLIICTHCISKKEIEYLIQEMMQTHFI